MSVLDYRPGIEDYTDPARGRAGSWVGWAIYLGMSWTWCIGMFLPVLLVRDYGFWAWVIFAIPNVVGAAAMGWVLKDRASQSMTLAHRPAIKAFSLVTATFQFFFALWMFESVGAGFCAWATFALALLVLSAAPRDDHAQGIAYVVFIGSLVTVLFGAAQGSLSVPPPVSLSLKHVLELCALIPVSILGFALNPYLDATFHLARQRLPNHRAGAAFTLGFGFFFFMMIIYSLFYVRLLIWNAGAAQRAGVIGHWTIQLALTIGLHWYGVPREGERERPTTRWLRIGLTFALAGIAWSITVLTPFDGELVYRCFMGFYGLVFPAYVWLCMIPGRGRVAPSGHQLTVFGATVLAALPFYWLGFVERRMLWLLPGVAIWLAARWALPKQRETQPDLPPLAA